MIHKIWNYKTLLKNVKDKKKTGVTICSDRRLNILKASVIAKLNLKFNTTSTEFPTEDFIISIKELQKAKNC